MELSKQSVQDKLLRARLRFDYKKVYNIKKKAKFLSIISYFEVLNAKNV